MGPIPARIGLHALWGDMDVTAWLQWKDFKQAALIGAAMVLLGIVVLAVSLNLQSLRPGAEGQLRKLDIVVMGRVRLKMPCAGMIDTGFVVSYRKQGDPADRQGRICHSLTGGAWTWHPNTNDMREAMRVLQ